MTREHDTKTMPMLALLAFCAACTDDFPMPFCASDACNSACSDECGEGEVTACDAQNQRQTCGQFDADECREWSAPASCEATCTPAWTIEVVDACVDHIDAGLGLAIDADGAGHAAYNCDSDLRYAKQRVGEPWIPRTIVHNDDSIVESHHYYAAKLALGPTGTPHVLYSSRIYAGTLSDYDWYLNVAVPDGPAWDQYRFKTHRGYSWNQHEGSTIAVDASNRVHVVSGWGHRWLDNGAWSAVKDIGVSGYPALTIDSTGRAHLLYKASDDLVYRALSADSATWGAAVVAESNGDMYSTAIAVNAAGKPHIAYAAGEGLLGTYYAAQTTAGAWPRTTVEAGATNLALAVTPGGEPHVAYLAGGALYHARHVSGAWVAELVDEGPGLSVNRAVEGEVAIAIAPDGSLHILYRSESAKELRHATTCQ